MRSFVFISYYNTGFFAIYQSIKRMAECFGPLESFKLFSSGDDRVTCPPEHDTDRCPNMDAGIWEIKWGHRDDCITALNVCSIFHHATCYKQSLIFIEDIKACASLDCHLGERSKLYIYPSPGIYTLTCLTSLSYFLFPERGNVSICTTTTSPLA